jgi:hypothetical protein
VKRENFTPKSVRASTFCTDGFQKFSRQAAKNAKKNSKNLCDFATLREQSGSNILLTTTILRQKASRFTLYVSRRR